MRYFYYVHTGHRIGLDRFHRAAAIVSRLQEFMDITLLCSDFRIAAQARDYGIKRAVGVDVVRNIPQIAQHGDKIIFDSAELNPTLLEDMTRFFSTFIRVTDDPADVKHPKEFLISPYLDGEGICQAVAIDERYYEQLPKTIPAALFFGDDDYEKDLEKYQGVFQSAKMDLLMGFYHFLGYENSLKESFGTIHDAEAYDEVVRRTDVLISASPQAVLENLAGGGRPVYLQRQDYPKSFIPLFRSLGIPILEQITQEYLIKAISNASSNKYHNVEKRYTQIADFVKETFAL